MKQFFTAVAFVQSTVYFVTGIWPLISVQSFMAVTGPKIDVWLVQVVGLLLVAISVALFTAVYRQERTVSIGLLGLLSAFFLAAADSYFVGKDVISPIYLLDAVFEIGLIICWVRILLFDHFFSMRVR